MSTLPSLHEWQADPGWQRIEFISDLHLQESEAQTFDAWRRYLEATSADAVLILGDLFEAWVGDDARTSGFEARCTQVLREASARRRIAFMQGNRDFLLGAEMLRDGGVTALPDPTVLLAFGQRVLLSHGDALCIDDTAYQAFRQQVRSAAWQQDFLARTLEQRRALARQMRDASELHQRGRAPGMWSDVDPATALEWLGAAGSNTLVHGHTHRPASVPIAPGFERHVLSDWDLHATPPRAQVLELTAAGFARRALTGA